MPTDEINTWDDPRRPVLPWRLIAGIFLHLLVPFYLIAVIADVLLTAGDRPSAGAMLHRMLAASPLLLGGYGALAVLLASLAALVDPLLRARRNRRLGRDPRLPLIRAEQLVRQAVDQSRGRFGSVADMALSRLHTAQWDFSDPSQQAIARDLAEVAARCGVALDTAICERRQLIMEGAAQTFERLAEAQAERAMARARQDEQQAQSIAAYVELRYGASDFSGSGT